MSTINVGVHHVTRVEGHGNIVVDARKGEIKECRFEVVEAPRFFEAFVRGRPYYELNLITCRICGICSVGHNTTSLRATEKALGVKPAEQTVLLRKLNFHGETIDSHVLHTYYLVAPDFLGVPSVIPLVETLRILKDIGYDGPITAEPFSKKLDGIPPQEAASMIIGMLNKLWSEAGLC